VRHFNRESDSTAKGGLMQGDRQLQVLQFHPGKARCPVQDSLFHIQQGIVGLARFPAKQLASTPVKLTTGEDTDVARVLGILSRTIAELRSSIMNVEAGRAVLPAATEVMEEV
jgi:hypothetical protein